VAGWHKIRFLAHANIPPALCSAWL
jgi:hypothetical protein